MAQTYTYSHEHPYPHTGSHFTTWACTSTHPMHKHIHTCGHTHMSVHLYTGTYRDTHMLTYTHVHIQSQIHIHTHVVSIHTQYVLKKRLDLRGIKLYAKAKAIILCRFQVKSQSQYFSFTPRTHFVKLLKKTFQEKKKKAYPMTSKSFWEGSSLESHRHNRKREIPFDISVWMWHTCASKM